MLQTLTIHVNIQFTALPVVMQVEKLVTVLDMLGFRQLTVFGKMGKIGCQSALYLGESFCLEGTANVTCIDKHATYDRKVIGI